MRISPIIRSDASIAAKWVPLSNSLQCTFARHNGESQHRHALLRNTSGPAEEFAVPAYSMRLVKKRSRSTFGFNAIQSTRPQTLAYGLHESPIGLLAWTSELFYDFGDAVEAVFHSASLTILG